ncbi:MAG: hypothetical protein ABFD08_14355 [Syntrophomonas sp.]
MKKILIYISLFIFLTTAASFALDSAIARKADVIPPYCLSFASIGAIFQESRLDAWAKINTDQQEKAEIQEISAALGLGENAWSKQVNKKFNRYLFSMEDTSYMIIWEQSNINQAFLRITIESSDPYADLPRYENIINGINGYNWHFNYTFNGEINSIVDDQSMQVLMDTLIVNLKGRQTSNYCCGESWSATAINEQKPIIQHYNRFESAMRREKELGKTKIWLGIPDLQNSY